MLFATSVMTNSQKKISVVIPCYNESGTIQEMYNRLIAVFKKIGCGYEIVYADNASTDNSERLFRDLAEKDTNVSVIFMSRNFGSSSPSITAGLRYTSGDAAVLIDGDIQDPPELIESFVNKWQEGNQVVYGIRINREEGVFLRAAKHIFYWLFQKLSYVPIPRDAGDFCLMDRRVLDVINAMPEKDQFLRGLRAWAGFKQIGIPYKRTSRKAGKTSNSFKSHIYWARKAIFSFSYAPLEWISYLALLTTAFAFLGIVAYLALAVFYPAPRGFLSLVVIVLFLGAIQLLSLSIIGEYLGKIFEEIKGRPQYVIQEILNNHRKNST
jgi:polyisoprenyl-phosphate glycosyltransferase